jgi:hypothetical protein
MGSEISSLVCVRRGGAITKQMSPEKIKTLASRSSFLLQYVVTHHFVLIRDHGELLRGVLDKAAHWHRGIFQCRRA